MTEKNLDVMLNSPVVITGLDGKEYKISRLSFPDAFRLADKISLMNLVPAVALTDKQQRENLLEIVVTVLNYHHPELTKEKLTQEKIFDLGHIRKIIDIALDINELKK